LQEYRDAGLLFRFIRSCVQEHADASHAFALLRAGRERPRRRRAPEQCDELATFHSSVSRASSRKDSTSQYGRRLVRCGNSIGPMTGLGSFSTDWPARATRGMSASL